MVLSAGGEAQTVTTATVFDDASRSQIDTDPLGRITTTQYDEMGRVIAITNPDGDTRHIAYDTNGNTLQEFDFAGRITTYQLRCLGPIAAANRATG